MTGVWAALVIANVWMADGSLAHAAIWLAFAFAMLLREKW